MKRLRFLVKAAVFLAGGVALSAFAQEAGGRKQERIGANTLRYEYGLIWDEGEERLWLFHGNVELAGPNTSVRADRMLAWTKASEPKLELREIYVEGNVVFRRTDPKSGTESALRAERLYYDFLNHRAYAIELRGRSYEDRIRTPVVVRAREARATSRGQWRGEDVSLTTCTYGVPHYHVRFQKAVLSGERLHPDAEPYDIWPFEDWSVRGEGLSADIFGVPVFFWPVLAFGSAVSEFPINSVRGGHTSRFGYWVESDWGVVIRKGLVDALLPVENAPGDDGEKWGELEWEVDWRRKRGWAGGLDLSWRWANYFGYVDTYYLRDSGGDPDIPFDLQFLPLERKDRFRGRFFHRHQISPQWRFELEASYLTDRNLLAEFFEKEFKEGKEQESVAYVRWIDGHMAGYLMERHRLNDFQTQVEYLPRGRFFVFDQPLTAGITYSAHIDAGNLRAVFDEELGLERQETYRLDVLQELARPFVLGPVALAPYLSARTTLYHEDLEEDTEHRFLAGAGFRLSTEIQGVHDLTWEEVGLRRVRHAARFEARYANNVENTVDPADLFGFDATDRLDEFEEVALEMRHRFQTKVKEGDALVTHEFLEVGAAIEYYPDSDRDSVGFNENNYAFPFHWITLKPHDAGGTMERRHWSNLHWDASFRPRSLFTMSASGEYNPVHQQEEVREYLLHMDLSASFRASVGEIFARDVTNAFTAGVRWQITEKWRVDAEAQYDFEQDEFVSQRATLTRDLHDFMVEAVWEIDEGRDERRFYINVYPKFVRQRK